MRILFLIGATSRVRNFDKAITMLAERGHTVRLAGRIRKGELRQPGRIQHPAVEMIENPTVRVDEWRDHVEFLRSLRDYTRYLDARFAKAMRLVQRAADLAPTGFPQFCEAHPWLKRHWKLLGWALKIVEDVIPSDRAFEAFLEQERPDVVLVTPLVTFESYQTDYVKSAHKLGLPIAFLPFSWDNLTNKGLMRILPDRVLVWNETQKREAVKLHGVPADRVVVTGAPRFDDFFARTPKTTREVFCKKFGLDPARPLILYLGSSPLTGPNEVELVRRWAEDIRRSSDSIRDRESPVASTGAPLRPKVIADIAAALRRAGRTGGSVPALASCGILVRPHPACLEQWADVDLSELGVAIARRSSRNADQDLYDCLYHAATVVGLNTSAMLEAGIVGKSVHTLLIPGFDVGQVGTLHFQYLIHAHGGLVTVARSFSEHRSQLAAALVAKSGPSERSLHFVEGFLRPHGLDRPVAPILASEIERVREIRKRPRRSTPAWHHPLRQALLAWLRTRASAGRSRDSGRGDPIATSHSLRPVSSALEELRQGSDPILAGPWLDDVTHELLYWIPFLRWAVAAGQIPWERLVIVSRGGVKAWYGSLAARYVDADNLFAPAELDTALRRAVPQRKQNPKQGLVYPLDQEVARRAAEAFGATRYQLLHPMHMFRVLRRLTGDRALDQMRDVARYERLPVQEAADLADQLPADYVAVGFTFGEAFPDDERTRRVMADALRHLRASYDLVVLTRGFSILGRSAVDGRPTGRVHRIEDVVTTDSDLELQSKILARARAFVGSYGDLSYLAAFCGTDSVSYYSGPIPEHHLEVANHVFRGNGLGTFRVFRTEEFDPVQLVAARAGVGSSGPVPLADL